MGNKRLHDQLLCSLTGNLKEMLPEPLSRRIRLSLAPLKLTQKNRTNGLICPFLPPRLFVKSPSIRKMDGRGGGDRTHRRDRTKIRLRRNPRPQRRAGRQDTLGYGRPSASFTSVNRAWLIGVETPSSAPSLAM